MSKKLLTMCKALLAMSKALLASMILLASKTLLVSNALIGFKNLRKIVQALMMTRIAMLAYKPRFWLKALKYSKKLGIMFMALNAYKKLIKFHVFIIQ